MTHIKTIEGGVVATHLRVAVAAARWNDLVMSQLVAGALETLRRHGAEDSNVLLFRCPGAFELPALVKRLALSGRYDAVVALGCVIRGGTPHFDYVAGEAAKGIGAVALESPCAVSFGVLTCDTMEQALERAGLKGGNKGVEATTAAIEQANLFKEVARLGKSTLSAVNQES